MKAPTSYRLCYRHRDPSKRSRRFDYCPPRQDRIVESLRAEIAGGGAERSLRIRMVFQNPREIYRLEIEVPEMNYQRTTLLDRDTLEDLLEIEEVREVVSRALN